MLKEEKILKGCKVVVFLTTLFCLGLFLYTACFCTVSCATIAGLIVSWSAFTTGIQCLIVLFKCKLKIVKKENKEEVIDGSEESKAEQKDEVIVDLDMPVDNVIVVEEPVKEQPKSKAKKSKAKAEQAE